MGTKAAMTSGDEKSRESTQTKLAAIDEKQTRLINTAMKAKQTLEKAQTKEKLSALAEIHAREIAAERAKSAEEASAKLQAAKQRGDKKATEVAEKSKIL